MKKGITRRSFLTGAAVSAVMATGLAGCSTHRSRSDDANNASNGTVSDDNRWSWSKAPDAIPDSDISDTYDCDICIVGLGAAGAPSAMYSAMHGAKTVVLQKGDHAISNGWCANAINNKAWLDSGGAPFDTTELYAQFAPYANGRDNPRLVKTFLDRGGEVMNWILDQTTEIPPVCVEHGQTLGWYENNDFQTRYSRYADLLNLMAQKAEDAGAQMLWNTPAQQLITDGNGTVTGVIGQTQDGNYVKVNASKGVLLACGDITDDQEMVECYAPLLSGIQNLHGAPNNTGDAIKMGSWIGAQVTPAPHAIMMHFDPTRLPEGDAPFSGIPWLRVNENGERFANEDLPYQSVVLSVAAQPDRVAFQICDRNWMNHINDYPNPNSHSRENPDPEGNWNKFLGTGAIKQANTLEELADAAGINDKQTFVATVNHYNELCDKGHDDDFGVNGTFMSYNAIKEPPFYAIKRIPNVLATVGGLQVNDHNQVLSQDGGTIGHLYAAGDDAGSFYGHEYPMFLPGGSIGRGFILGILAVKDALGDYDTPTQ